MLRVASSRLLAGSPSSLRMQRLRVPHRGVLSQAANKRLDELATRHEELSKKVQAGHDANAMRELHGLDDVLERRRALAAATSELDDLRELLDDADADIRAEAERELDNVKATVDALEAATAPELVRERAMASRALEAELVQ